MPFSEEYFRLFENDTVFHDRVAKRYSPRSEGGKITERLLRCIWYDGLYDPEHLLTRDGEKIEVHSPGTWNLEAGPDFNRAEISIANKRQQGDIEIHLEPAGWRLHGHSRDARYDNVILHVTLTPPDKKQPPPLSRHGTKIPDAALWDCLLDDLQVLKCSLRPEEYPYRSMENFGRCRRLLDHISPEARHNLLCIAGDARMIAKQHRFAYESESEDLDQVAYGAILEGMGYKAYREQFGQLARQLPYERLRQRALSLGGNTAGSDVAHLTQALLFGTAGLLGTADDGVGTSAARRYLRQILRLWTEHGSDLPGNAIEWKTAAVRPANFPERRIAGAGHILAESYEPGLHASILTCMLTANTRTARKSCIEYFTSAKDDFWSRHYSISGKRLSRPVGLIGRDRALAIVVNVFVPLGLLHARSQNCLEDEDLVHRFYCDLPSPQPNNITRLMEYRLFGILPSGQMARSARAQQGLLQIFADWCSEDPSCENCGIVTSLQGGYFGSAG